MNGFYYARSEKETQMQIGPGGLLLITAISVGFGIWSYKLIAGGHIKELVQASEPLTRVISNGKYIPKHT